MAITVEQRKDASAIRLEGAIDIALAAGLKSTLIEALKTGNAVLVALDANADLDVAAIQLLWAAEREAKAAGARFTLDGEVPAGVSASLKDAGFERFPVPV